MDNLKITGEHCTLVVLSGHAEVCCQRLVICRYFSFLRRKQIAKGLLHYLLCSREHFSFEPDPGISNFGVFLGLKESRLVGPRVPTRGIFTVILQYFGSVFISVTCVSVIYFLVISLRVYHNHVGPKSV